MSVVYDHGERLAAIHALKASGRTLGLRERLGNGLQLTPAGHRGSGGGEHVIDVYLTDKLRANFHHTLRSLQAEISALRRRANTFRTKAAAFQTVGQNLRFLRTGKFGELPAIGVICINDGDARRRRAASDE